MDINFNNTVEIPHSVRNDNDLCGIDGKKGVDFAHTLLPKKACQLVIPNGMRNLIYSRFKPKQFTTSKI
jgi:hypothetical protein